MFTRRRRITHFQIKIENSKIQYPKLTLKETENTRRRSTKNKSLNILQFTRY